MNPSRKIAKKAQTGDVLKKMDHDIVRAAEANDLHEVFAALNEYSPCINFQDPITKMTALHWAGANRNLALGQTLFGWTQDKVDPWLRDKWDRLPVDLAIKTGNETLINLFHAKMFPEDYQYDFDPLDPPKGVLPVLSPKKL